MMTQTASVADSGSNDCAAQIPELGNHAADPGDAESLL
jgi:hypothetical protein